MFHLSAEGLHCQCLSLGYLQQRPAGACRLSILNTHLALGCVRLRNQSKADKDFSTRRAALGSDSAATALCPGPCTPPVGKSHPGRKLSVPLGHQAEQRKTWRRWSAIRAQSQTPHITRTTTLQRPPHRLEYASHGFASPFA